MAIRWPARRHVASERKPAPCETRNKYICIHPVQIELRAAPRCMENPFASFLPSLRVVQSMSQKNPTIAVRACPPATHRKPCVRFK